MNVRAKRLKPPRTLEKIKIRERRNGLQLIKTLKIYHFLGVRLPEQFLIIGTLRARILWALSAMCSEFIATATNLTGFPYMPQVIRRSSHTYLSSPKHGYSSRSHKLSLPLKVFQCSQPLTMRSIWLSPQFILCI